MRKLVFCFALAAAFCLPFSVSSENHNTAPDRYFLVEDQVVNSQNLLPPPPTAESGRFAYDVEQYQWGKKMRDTDRGRLAVRDANLNEGWIDRVFSEAFGMELTPENTPEIYRLISGMKEDAGDLSTRDAKNHYMRPRPFMVFCEASGTPDDEEGLRKNGSYPSGHTAIGWASALVLSEINPERQDEIINRGYEFGQSRVIVGAHFQSDVDMGRIVGSAVVASLHSNPEFLKQLDKAKKEFAKLSKEKSRKDKK